MISTMAINTSSSGCTRASFKVLMSNLTKLNDITARLWICQMIIEMDEDPEASVTRAHGGHELVYDI